MIQPIFKGFFLKSFSTSISIGFKFAVSVILARSLGKDNFGLWVMVFTVVSFFWMLADMGISGSIVKFLPLRIKENSYQDLLKVGFLIKLFLGTVFSIISFLFADFIAIYVFKRPVLSPYLRIGSGLILVQSIWTFSVSIFQGKQDWKSEGIISSAENLVYFLILLFFNFFFALNLINILILNIIAYLIVAFIAFYLFKKYFTLQNRNLDSSFVNYITECKTLLKFAIPIFMSNFLFYFLIWTDRTMLGIYRSNEELSFYFIASNIIIFGRTIFAIIEAVLYPYLAEREVYVAKKKKIIFSYLFNWFFVSTILGSILVIYVSKPLIMLIYGSEYLESVVALKYLLAVFIIRVTSLPITLVLITLLSKPHIVRNAQFMGLVIGVILNFLLIPKYGYRGAILANFAAFSTSFLYNLFYIQKKTYFKIDYFLIFKYLIVFLFFISLLFIPMNGIFNFINITISAIILLILYLFKHEFNLIEAKELLLNNFIMHKLKNK